MSTTISLKFQGVFFFSCIWSIGATLESPGRPKFDLLFRGLLEKEFPEKVYGNYQVFCNTFHLSFFLPKFSGCFSGKNCSEHAERNC